MKTPRNLLFTSILVVAMAFGLAIYHPAANTADTGPDKFSLPVGKWEVTFTNGVVETVEIKDDGSVTVSDKHRNAKGKASIKDGFVEVRFEDDRVEQWSLDSDPDRMTVRHWHPISAMPNGSPEIGSAALADAKAPALEVHEWGTFTVLQGSDGQVIPWYQAPDKLVDLPPFVKRPIRIMSKARAPFGGNDTVRMETPVLYFYPEKKMDVTVSANFNNGRITEIFPPAFSPSFGFGGPTIWHGTLLPPDSPEREKIPAATGPRGRHYGAAREVPDAWLFRMRQLPHASAEMTDGGTTPAIPISQLVAYVPPGQNTVGRNPEKEKPVDPIDHFIFYRGAGNHSFNELRTTQGRGPDNFTLTNYGGETVPKLFALRVQDGQSSWLALEQLKKIEYQKGKALNQQSFTFPAPMGATDDVAVDLRTAMIDSLHDEGLTRDEAKAMVATWDNLWFTEPGTRILAILPQKFADQMVPLAITPKPTKIDRVFVARVEMLTREVEEKLTTLLGDPATGKGDASEIAEDATRLDDIQLGRYAAGGMERALRLLERQTRARFAKLEQALKKAQEEEEKKAADPEQLAAARAE